ncbi:MAG: hypothetical protein AB1798_13400, partial [Spirochaetota bacterium]
LALGVLLSFILGPWIPFKAVLVLLYGIGIAPVFPLLMARGVKEYPDQPGAVTGILFAALSLGGMVFPLLLGAVASVIGIARSYYITACIVFGLLVSNLLWMKKEA